MTLKLLSAGAIALAIGAAALAGAGRSDARSTPQEKSQAASAASKGEYRLGERLKPSAPASAQGAAGYKETTWEALVPKGWNPAAMMKGVDLATMSDGDPRATEMLQKMREAWDNAPVEPTMNGQRIRIPGFMVPLDTHRNQVTEFLLVPYFGACVHSPPPPANQTIHVVPAKPVKNLQMMDPVWVNGTIETTAKSTMMGNAGYRLKADSVTLYTGKEGK